MIELTSRNGKTMGQLFCHIENRYDLKDRRQMSKGAGGDYESVSDDIKVYLFTSHYLHQGNGKLHD